MNFSTHTYSQGVSCEFSMCTAFSIYDFGCFNLQFRAFPVEFFARGIFSRLSILFLCIIKVDSQTNRGSRQLI